MGPARHKVFQGNAGMSWFLTKEDPSEYPGKTLSIRLTSTKILKDSPHTTIKGVRSVTVDFPTSTTLGFWQMVAHPFIDLVHHSLTSVNGKQRLSSAPKLLNLSMVPIHILIKSWALSFSMRKSKGGYFKNLALCTFIKTTLIQNGSLPDELFHQFPQEQ